MSGLEIACIIAGVALLILAARLWILDRRLRRSEGERLEIEGEEHRMFDFLHLLGEAIEEERSLSHLYRTIVEGVEDVLDANGAALYLTKGEELHPGHLTDGCPPLVSVPSEVAGRGDKEVHNWLRLGRVKREGEWLDQLLLDRAARWWKKNEDPVVAGGREVMAVPLQHAGKSFGVLVAVRTERAFRNNDWDVFRSAAEQSAFGLGNALLHREVQEKRHLDNELRTAREVQQVLLPNEDPSWAGYRVRGTNIAARLISGDYFDYIDLPEGRHGVAIADVSGKGVGAGLVMATCRSALRAFAPGQAGPLAALSNLNVQLFGDMRQDMFVSMAYAVLDNGSGRVQMARAGHDAPLLFRKELGQVELLKPGGLALGIDRGPVFDRVTKELEFEMATGDVLLFYTDGLNEAENEHGEEYGRARLREEFLALAPSGSEGVVEGLQNSWREFVGERKQMDDLTLVVVERV